jgi:hypothetical protein
MWRQRRIMLFIWFQHLFLQPSFDFRSEHPNQHTILTATISTTASSDFKSFNPHHGQLHSYYKLPPSIIFVVSKSISILFRPECSSLTSTISSSYTELHGTPLHASLHYYIHPYDNRSGILQVP